MATTGAETGAEPPPQQTHAPSGPPEPSEPLPPHIEAPPVAGSRTDTETVFAIASLVIGIISLCGLLIPICGLTAAVVGLVLGFLGLKSSRRSLAIIGLAVNGFVILAGIALIIFAGVMMGLSGMLSDISY